jgi:hypothetical protein
MQAILTVIHKVGGDKVALPHGFQVEQRATGIEKGLTGATSFYTTSESQDKQVRKGNQYR